LHGVKPLTAVVNTNVNVIEPLCQKATAVCAYRCVLPACCVLITGGSCYPFVDAQCGASLWPPVTLIALGECVPAFFVKRPHPAAFTASAVCPNCVFLPEELEMSDQPTINDNTQDLDQVTVNGEASNALQALEFKIEKLVDFRVNKVQSMGDKGRKVTFLVDNFDAGIFEGDTGEIAWVQPADHPKNYSDFDKFKVYHTKTNRHVWLAADTTDIKLGHHFIPGLDDRLHNLNQQREAILDRS
jgi:hypothetical protein